MRAAWYTRLGPANEVIEVGELPTPTAGPGEVRVKLHASGVNPADCKRRGGVNYGQEYPLVIPNSDGAGVIDQVGLGVDPARLGQRVWLYNGQRGRAFGTAAEYIALAAHLVLPLPDNTSFEEGACLGIPSMTAHCCVFAKGPVEGKTVLVTGGAGAVGHYAVQWARWGGATVIATVSSEIKAAHARDGGADYVINYRTENVAERIKELAGGVDRVVDVDFGGNLATSLAILRVNGAIAAYSSSVPEPTLPFFRMMRECLTIQLVFLNRMPREVLDQATSDTATWLASGMAKHRIASRFPLEQTAQAHQFVESGTKLGTVIVEVR